MRKLLLALFVTVLIVILAIMPTFGQQIDTDLCPKFGYEDSLSPYLLMPAFVSTGRINEEGMCQVVLIQDDRRKWLNPGWVQAMENYSFINTGGDYIITVRYTLVYEVENPRIIKEIQELDHPQVITLNPTAVTFLPTRWLETDFPQWDGQVLAFVLRSNHSPVYVLPDGSGAFTREDSAYG